jgi:hypothetical protein
VIGGDGNGDYFSVWNSGIITKVTNIDPSSSSGTPSSTTSAKPSVVTIEGEFVLLIM